MSHRLLILLVPAAMLLQTGVGCADAIDGDWCGTDGMRMSIRGEKITIPSGKQLKATTAATHSITSFRPVRMARAMS